MFDTIHPYLIASVPTIAAGLTLGVLSKAKTAEELSAQIDTKLQHALCEMASDPRWDFRIDDEAWTAIVQLGGRRHLLEQARLLFALAIEKAKDSPEDAKAREMIEAKFTQLALLLKHNWRRLFVPQMHAHSCIELYADMCSIWEQLEIDSQWEPMA